MEQYCAIIKCVQNFSPKKGKVYFMKVKQWLASSLAVLMLVSTVGCGDNSSSSKAESKSNNSSAVVSETAMPEKDYATTTDGSAKVKIDGTKFMVGDKELWFNGVNAPWDKWNDFGGGFNFEFWQDNFQKLHNSGVNAARIWIICNGDVGMAISADGTFDGATTAHWEDLDNLFYLAEQYQIYIMATVQSFDNFKDQNQNYQAWRTLIQDSDKTDMFVDNYIVPLVQRYGESDYFWSVDLCNEPDWIICNGDVGMAISADGTFDGATTAHWEDLDNLFYLAEQYQIYIMATVQSFDNFKDQNQNYQAWRTLIQDSDKTDMFVDNYIVPLVQRYGKSDYFWSVDLCNEPDWIVENEECGKLDWLYLEQYYAKAAAAIHANSDVLVTVGMGMIKYNSDSQQGNKISDSELQTVLSGDKYDKSLAYVDFYSTHWYTWMQGMWGYPFSESPTDFGLDGTKPCVIGECPAVASDSDFDITSAYEDAYNNGWNGVFAWKTSGQDDGCGLWLDIQPAIEKMAGICEDKIFPNGKKAV